MGFIDKKLKKRLLMVTCVVLILFLAGIMVNSIKVSNDATCSTTNNYNIDSMKNKYSDLVINDDTVYYQDLKLENKDLAYYENYLFCFNSIISSVDSLEISVISNDYGVLGTSYFFNDTGYSCVDIGSVDFKQRNNFLGVKCANCDTQGNNLTLYVSEGNDIVSTLIDNEPSVYRKIDYNLKGINNCKLLNFKLFRYMIIFVLLISLIWLIDLFINYIDKEAFDGWN